MRVANMLKPSAFVVLLLTALLAAGLPAAAAGSVSGGLDAEPALAVPVTGYRTGLEFDGRSSASVIAAQRSHAVSDEDQTLLAVFTGIFAIGLIVFVVRFLIKK